MSDDFYHKKAVAKVLAVDVYRPEELIHEISNFIQSQVVRLEREKMLSLAGFRFSTNMETKQIRVYVARLILAGQDHFFGDQPCVVLKFGWGFCGMEALANRRRFRRLGKKAFIESHWQRFAERLLKEDALARVKHNAPMPEGLAAWVEAAEIAEASRGKGSAQTCPSL